jgi:hypothetical protein
MTGLLGSAAHTACQAATRRPGWPRPEIEVLPWKPPETSDAAKLSSPC